MKNPDNNMNKYKEKFLSERCDTADSIQFFFSRKKAFSLRLDKKYEIEELAIYAANCEILFKKISDLRNALFQIVLFSLLLLHTNKIKTEKINLFVSPFLTTDIVGHILWYWFSIISVFVLTLTTTICLTFLIGFIRYSFDKGKNIFRIFIEMKKEYEFSHTAINAWRNFVMLIILFFGAHYYFGIQFKIDNDIRLLTGLEFAYFFLMTFTTVGFGDIVPVGNTGHIFAILIHLLTLYSIIFIFTKISQGPKRDIIEEYYSKVIERHVKRLELIQSLIVNILGKSPGDTTACPQSHKHKKGSAKNCPVCHGTYLADVSVILPYATWPSKDFFDIAQSSTGKTKKELMSILNLNQTKSATL